MRAFLIRARSASTDSDQFLSGVGQDAHSEILAHSLMNAIFIAQSHRDDVIVYLVLESTRDFSRTITVDTRQLGKVGGFHEQALVTTIATSLEVSKGMAKESERAVAPGISVRTISFEKLVQELAESWQLFVMDKKGGALREQPFDGDPCFILTDHVPMPRKSFNSLARLGVQKISLGPKMLFASQCIVLLHNELDLRGHD